MIQTIEEFLIAVRKDASGWEPSDPKWFRGEPNSGDTPLTPTLYRGFCAQRTLYFRCFAHERARFIIQRQFVSTQISGSFWPGTRASRPGCLIGLRAHLLDCISP